MIVAKFGGSSVANISRIRSVANIIIDKYISKQEQVVIVVSAMLGVTNHLSKYINEIGFDKDSLEKDVVLSSGEPISTSLVALMLCKLGFEAQSFTGWQLPIITDDESCNAKIIDISTGNLHNCLSHNIIPVVSGFQGITELSRITTLGRGGSDTTAVALSIALGAKRCDIYTDVDGVYTADPRIVPLSAKISKISYEEMFEMSFNGAKILQSRSVELAMKNNIKIKVLSSFIEADGTEICDINDNNEGKTSDGHMEKLKITGITSEQNIVKINIKSGLGQSTIGILSAIADSNVSFSSFHQSLTPIENIISFVVPSAQAETIVKKCEHLKNENLITDFKMDCDISKISIVGIGIGSNFSIVQTILETMAKNCVEIYDLLCSPLNISFFTRKQNVVIASTALHTALELDNIS